MKRYRDVHLNTDIAMDDMLDLDDEFNFDEGMDEICCRMTRWISLRMRLMIMKAGKKRMNWLLPFRKIMNNHN